MATATGSQFTFAAVSATIGLIVALGASPASAAPAVDGEFAVSGVGTDNTIVKGPDGNVQLEQAAATMGAGPVRVWTRVILPLVRPGITGAAAVCITICMTEFANPSLLGQGVRDYVANLVQSVVLGRDNVYLGSAIGLSLLVIVMILVTVLLVLGQTRGGDPLEEPEVQR